MKGEEFSIDEDMLYMDDDATDESIYEDEAQEKEMKKGLEN